MMMQLAILLAVASLGPSVHFVESDTVHVAPPTLERETDRASIEAALEKVQPGGTVLFAEGTYLTGGSIRVAVPDVTLAGSAAGTTLRGCDPAELINAEPLTDRCAGLDLMGARQTVRNLTFEHMSWASLQISGGRSEQGRLLPAREGGHLIEGNTFRDSDSFNVISDAAELIVIRGNTFVNTYHAVAIQGRNVHFLENVIRAPEHGRIPYGRPDIAIGIAQFSPNGPRCADNIIAGNLIEGHSDGVAIGVFGPGTNCRGNVVRDNQIAVGRVTPTELERGMLGDGVGSTAVGVAVRLLNIPATCKSMPPGAEPWFMCPPGSGADAVLADNVIEGNRITGGEGIAIEILHASRNRIVNNTVSGLTRLDRFPHEVLRRPPHYVEGNGSGIWISPGSDENEVAGNTFENGTGDAVVVEGARNVVETRDGSDGVRDLGAGNRVRRSSETPHPQSPQAPQVDTRQVDIDGLPMHVQTAGWHHCERGQPIVVLENGAGVPLQGWQPILAALAEFAPVVAYDRAGIGQSPWDEQPPTPEHVNRKLRALLDQIDAPPPYVLVGFSWGGALIQYFAGHWPDEVAGLVFIDSPDPRWRRQAELAAVAEFGGGESERLAFYRALAPVIAQLPPSHQAELSVIEDLVTRDGGDLAALRQPTVPVARLVAGRHEAMPPGIDMPFDERAYWHGVLRHSLGRFAESLPASQHATLTVAAHAGHYIMGDDPTLVIDAIRRVSTAAAARCGSGQ